MNMEQVIRQLQDTATVMAGIQARQAEVLKGHGEWLEQHELTLMRHKEWHAEHERTLAQIESNLREATEKLNALIVVVDGVVSKRKNGDVQ
jgi:hypothetical protein